MSFLWRSTKWLPLKHRATSTTALNNKDHEITLSSYQRLKTKEKSKSNNYYQAIVCQYQPKFMLEIRQTKAQCKFWQWRFWWGVTSFDSAKILLHNRYTWRGAKTWKGAVSDQKRTPNVCMDQALCQNPNQRPKKCWQMMESITNILIISNSAHTVEEIQKTMLLSTLISAQKQENHTGVCPNPKVFSQVSKTKEPSSRSRPSETRQVARSSAHASYSWKAPEIHRRQLEDLFAFQKFDSVLQKRKHW